MLFIKSKAKSNEIAVKKNENKHLEENLKVAKMEDKLQNYKEKSAIKMAQMLQK